MCECGFTLSEVLPMLAVSYLFGMLAMGGLFALSRVDRKGE